MQNHTKSLNKCLHSDTQSINIYTSKANIENGTIEMNYSEFKEYANKNATTAKYDIFSKHSKKDTPFSKAMTAAAKGIEERIRNIKVTEAQYNANKDSCVKALGAYAIAQNIHSQTYNAIYNSK